MLKDIAYLGRNSRDDASKPGVILTTLEADPAKHKAATRKGGLAKKAAAAHAKRYGGFEWNAGCDAILAEVAAECREAERR